MADHYYAVDIGRSLDPSKVTTGTSTSAAKHVELRTLDGAGLTRMDVLMALKQLEAYFQNHAPTP
ncbi:MAG: hypothetical protein IPK83_20430 [Planctomycetes bacterium]|nr:hypothetical protein [Planctomycetota bacterium]